MCRPPRVRAQRRRRRRLLHPTHGTREVPSTLLPSSHAFDSAAARYSKRAAAAASAAAPAAAAPAAARPQPNPALPTPLHAENSGVGERKSRCYGFVKAADYRKTYGQSSMYRALQPIQWLSAWCAQPGEWIRPSDDAVAVARADAAGAYTQAEDAHMAAALAPSTSAAAEAAEAAEGRDRTARFRQAGTSESDA